MVAITAAFVVFEWFAGQAAGLLVAVSSFGIRDVRTALTLRKVDPNRVRGRVCSWFYLAHASGCVLMASFPFYLIVSLEDNRQSPSQSSNLVNVQAAILFLSGLVGTLSCGLGMGLAMRRGVRVWVDPWFRLSWGAHRWPPEPTYGWPPILSRVPNRAQNFPLLVAVTVGFVLVLGPLISGVIVNSWRLGEETNGSDRLIFAIVTPVWVILARYSIPRSNRERLKNVVASTPRDCYPELRP